MEKLWQVVHVASRTEKKVCERLQNKGIDFFLPQQRVLRQWSDRKKWVDAVLITGYVFVHIDSCERLEVLQTPGVSRFLRHTAHDVVIAENEMQRFRMFVEKAEEPIDFSHEEIPTGTAVRVCEGKLVGFEGEVVFHKGKNKLCLRIQNLGQCLLEVPTTAVEILNKTDRSL